MASFLFMFIVSGAQLRFVGIESLGRPTSKTALARESRAAHAAPTQPEPSAPTLQA